MQATFTTSTKANNALPMGAGGGQISTASASGERRGVFYAKIPIQTGYCPEIITIMEEKP